MIHDNADGYRSSRDVHRMDMGKFKAGDKATCNARWLAVITVLEIGGRKLIEMMWTTWSEILMARILLAEVRSALRYLTKGI